MSYRTPDKLRMAGKAATVLVFVGTVHPRLTRTGIVARAPQTLGFLRCRALSDFNPSVLKIEVGTILGSRVWGRLSVFQLQIYRSVLP